MRFDEFTFKSQELIQNLQSLATQQKHQQIEPEHLLSAMKEQIEEMKAHWQREKEMIQTIRALKEELEQTGIEEQQAEAPPKIPFW